ncbi:MAG: hypothetical protein ACC726_10065 [Chloroflexota bacterium]
MTDRYEREQGLESIAREQEQQRIAQELHDGPLQSLVQLLRAFDTTAKEMPESQRRPLAKCCSTDIR